MGFAAAGASPGRETITEHFLGVICLEIMTATSPSVVTRYRLWIPSIAIDAMSAVRRSPTADMLAHA